MDIHKLARNKNIKKLINKDNNLLFLIDDEGNTVLHILYNNHKFLTWIAANVKDPNVDAVNKDGHTVLTKNIKQTQSINDAYYKNILAILKMHPDMKIPLSKPPLAQAIEQKKEFVAKLLLDYDPESKNNASLLLATYHNLSDTSEHILENISDINAEPLSVAILNKNYTVANNILDSNFDLTFKDKFMNTPLHTGFSQKDLPADIIAKLIFYGDMNVQNINGDTPLHILLSNHNWKSYRKLLEKKPLDIHIKNNKNKTPLDFVDKQDTIQFLDMITDPKSISNDDQINYIIPPESNVGLFNSDIIHNIIYTVHFLKKYRDLISVPTRKYIVDAAFNDKFKITKNTFGDQVLVDIVSNYKRLFYPIAPYLLVWRSSTQYYIDPDLEYYLKKCTSRFILLKLTLIVSHNSTHANILLYDRNKLLLERFEPYGHVQYLESDKLDKLLKNKFSRYLEINKYISPKGVGFQSLSDDTNIENKNLGDPQGYCLAWTFWYLEMRLRNPDIGPELLIDKLIKKILKEYPETKFMGFIRSYANELNKIKLSIMAKAGIPEKYTNNLLLGEKYQGILVKYLNSSFGRDILKA
jgi:hypothetical protein